MPKFLVTIAGATYEIYSRGRAAAVRAAIAQHTGAPVVGAPKFLRYIPGYVVYEMITPAGKIEAIIRGE
jgi:hypothetical protein